MLFNSVAFLIFFPVVVLVYALIPRKLRAVWLLAASYFFYMSWNAKYALLIGISTLITWLGGILLSKLDASGEADRKGAKRFVLAAVALINLGILFFFKYFGFAVHMLNGLLSAFHAPGISASLNVLLPVGISFYTFQALGYCIDVYRCSIPAEKNLLRYALFVSFFPQLVAGPIERSGNLLPQIDNIENIEIRNYDNIISGLLLMLWGMFQKVVLADRLAVLADTVFDSPWRYGSTALAVGAVAFSLQIYCDFGAYSNLAVGAARVLGIRLMNNFDAPYFSQSIPEFWRRWHISLSTWFRDYLYIPLGGNRKGRVRKGVNLFVTFLVSGLWHGAAWSFVAWGALHGAFCVLSDIMKKPLTALGDLLRVDRNVFSYRLGRCAVTFVLTTLAWVFFRAQSLKAAFFYLGRLFTRFDPWNLFNESIFTLGLDHREFRILTVSLLMLFFADLLRYRKKEEPGAFLLRQNLWFRIAAVVVLILFVLVYGAYGVDFDSAQFIYFAF